MYNNTYLIHILSKLQDVNLVGNRRTSSSRLKVSVTRFHYSLGARRIDFMIVELLKSRDFYLLPNNNKEI